MKSLQTIANNIMRQGAKLLKISQEKCVDMYHIGHNIADAIDNGYSERTAIAHIRKELGELLPTSDIGVYWSKHFSMSYTVYSTFTIDAWKAFVETSPIACPKSLNMIISALVKGDIWSEANFYHMVKSASLTSQQARMKIIALAREGQKVWEWDNDKLMSAIGNAPKKKTEKKESKNETETALAAKIEKQGAELDSKDARIAELEREVADLKAKLAEYELAIVTDTATVKA